MGRTIRGSFLILQSRIIIESEEDMKMKTILVILAGLFLISDLGAATLYEWVDDRGGLHFTDDYATIPPACRNRVKSQTSEDRPQTATPAASQPSLQKSGEDA